MHLYDVWLVYVRFTAIADLGQYFVNVTAELESDDCQFFDAYSTISTIVNLETTCQHPNLSSVARLMADQKVDQQIASGVIKCCLRI